MVIRGRTRGNGKQLASYLLSQGENEGVQILDVNGQDNANDSDLHKALLSMSLTSELTKSDKGLYHAQINPAYGEDKAMNMADWIKAADILGQKLGLDEQRRIIILHTKKDRIHAHVVWERFDFQKSKMISDSYSRLAQDKARVEMEQVFEHKRTPERNKNRPEMKTVLTDLWHKYTSGKEFIAKAKKCGYWIAAGLQRRPFMVVDSEGRSFDLVRQLDKVKTKEVRDRLKNEKLVSEKQAIEFIRQKQKVAEKEKIANDNSKKQKLAEQFASVSEEIMQAGQIKDFTERKNNAMAAFRENMRGTGNQAKEHSSGRKTQLAEEFASNKNEQLKKDGQKRLYLEKLKKGKNKDSALEAG